MPVNTPVTFQVQLAGLQPGQELDALAATIGYNPALLGPPSITGGGILPATLDDPADFGISPAAGQADASFLTFGELTANHITANGTFFSFTANVLSPGSGNLAFTWTDATLFNAGDPLSPIPAKPAAGTALGFSAVPVPEPGTLVLLLPLLIIAGKYTTEARRTQRCKR